MGKRLKSQRRGKGSPTFRATQNAAFDVNYISYDDEQKERVLKGQIIRVLNDRGKTAVLAEVLFENGKKERVIAAEGLFKGQEVEYGKKAGIDIGNALPVRELPEGCPIFNIELVPGDGGKLIRSAGSYALVASKEKERIYLKLPSGKTIALLPECRATIGNAAGGGRKEKPLIKAGKAFHLMKSLSRPYPIVRGVAMNPPSHPFGGSQHHPGKSKSVSRHAPPGRKVGAIASKRTGRKKKG